MSACTHPHTTDHSHVAGPHQAHSPPAELPPDPSPPRRFRLSGADVSASVAVFLIALPLSLGIALATGAPLQAGLVAAAVGGIVAGRLGGSPLQVSGPAAGLTVVTAELIQRYGWATTCAITVLAGLVQLVLGFAKVARAALVVSPAIVHGMLAGIGVTIAVAQAHIVLGGAPESSVTGNLRSLPGQLVHLRPAAVGVGVLALLLLFAWPRLPGRAGRVARRLPAPLVAVAGATAVAVLADLRLPRVDLPSWRSHALAGLPEGPVLGIAVAVLTTTLVCSVQSLLGAVAVDKLATARTSARHRPGRSDLDRELLGQGAANIVSGSLGGLPVAGVAVRSSANVHAGARTRSSTVLHGVWIVVAALLLVPVLRLIPLAVLAALVMAVGAQMVSLRHIRTVARHREVLVYAVTTPAVIFLGILQGVALGVAAAVALALHRLTRTRVTHAELTDGSRHVRVHGHLTFLAVPRLMRTLHTVPPGTHAVVELDGTFLDHAAYETLQDWQTGHRAQRGTVDLTAGSLTEAKNDGSCCRPWTPWHNHQCDRPRSLPEGEPPGSQLASGLIAFQRNTAPLVRADLARLAREGQRPSQLFLTCADSRLVTSIITSSGPGDLFVVRNVGNLVPRPGAESGDDSVAAAIEYAVDVLKVRSITVCGHSGCGAMQALLATPARTERTPLTRWLQHGAASLERAAATGPLTPRLAERTAGDPVEHLCLTNVMQQLDHLRAHECVRRSLAAGSLSLHGMYFHVGDAQAYLLADEGGSFHRVEERPLHSTG